MDGDNSMAAPVQCVLCTKIMERRELEAHICSDHLDYFPYRCGHCGNHMPTVEIVRFHATRKTHLPLKIREVPNIKKEKQLEEALKQSWTCVITQPITGKLSMSELFSPVEEKVLANKNSTEQQSLASEVNQSIPEQPSVMLPIVPHMEEKISTNQYSKTKWTNVPVTDLTDQTGVSPIEEEISTNQLYTAEQANKPNAEQTGALPIVSSIEDLSTNQLYSTEEGKKQTARQTGALPNVSSIEEEISNNQCPEQVKESIPEQTGMLPIVSAIEEKVATNSCYTPEQANEPIVEQQTEVLPIVSPMEVEISTNHLSTTEQVNQPIAEQTRELPTVSSIEEKIPTNQHYTREQVSDQIAMQTGALSVALPVQEERLVDQHLTTKQGLGWMVNQPMAEPQEKLGIVSPVKEEISTNKGPADNGVAAVRSPLVLKITNPAKHPTAAQGLGSMTDQPTEEPQKALRIFSAVEEEKLTNKDPAENAFTAACSPLILKITKPVKHSVTEQRLGCMANQLMTEPQKELGIVSPVEEGILTNKGPADSSVAAACSPLILKIKLGHVVNSTMDSVSKEMPVGKDMVEIPRSEKTDDKNISEDKQVDASVDDGDNQCTQAPAQQRLVSELIMETPPPQSKTSATTFKCFICKLEVSSSQRENHVNKHISMIEREAPWTCVQCGFIGKNISSVKIHVSLKHPDVTQAGSIQKWSDQYSQLLVPLETMNLMCFGVMDLSVLEDKNVMEIPSLQNKNSMNISALQDQRSTDISELDKNTKDVSFLHDTVGISTLPDKNREPSSISTSSKEKNSMGDSYLPDRNPMESVEKGPPVKQKKVTSIRSSNDERESYQICKFCQRNIHIYDIPEHVHFHLQNSSIFACAYCDFKAKKKGSVQAHITRKHKGGSRNTGIKDLSFVMNRYNHMHYLCFGVSWRKKRGPSSAQKDLSGPAKDTKSSVNPSEGQVQKFPSNVADFEKVNKAMKRRENDSKLLSCTVCDQKVRKNMVAAHIYINHIQKRDTLKCSHCGYGVSYNSSKMKIHMRKVHPDLDHNSYTSSCSEMMHIYLKWRKVCFPEIGKSYHWYQPSTKKADGEN